jgi:hypothetical protein
MIPEPQQTYLLEFLAALGPAAKDFVSLAPKPLSSHSQKPGEPRISTSSST